MAQFPSSIISFSTKVNGQVIEASDINSPQSEIVALETKVGKDGSAVTTSLDYIIKNPASGGGGHVQVANKGGTGQTSFTKGDILVASSSSVIAKQAVGTNNTVLIADSNTTTGVKWGAAPTLITSSTIAVSSVWTKPTGAGSNSMTFVELWGGGGSGGGCSAGKEGGGGGGGCYASGWFVTSVLGASINIAAGQGGNSSKSAGTQGGKSVFDVINSVLTAYGGGGGGVGSIDAAAGSGGGGGGTYAAGLTSSGDVGGAGGSILGGTGGTGRSSIYATYIGGCGGGGMDDGGATGVFVGTTILGGAGGGAVSSSVMGAGGLSSGGGNGSAGSILGASLTSVLSGSIPGGGGGASSGAGSSGEGGKGMIRITTFL